jgi:hypothetical protein
MPDLVVCLFTCLYTFDPAPASLFPTTNSLASGVSKPDATVLPHLTKLTPLILEVPAWYLTVPGCSAGSVTQTSCMSAGCMLARLVLESWVPSIAYVQLSE